jgi:two-component system, NtrC family, C4-dicarboxylate transport sensor histidine kinase DctB
MVTGRLKQLFLFAAALATIGLSIFVSQRFWYENGLKSLQAVNEQRVQLVVNALKAEVGRQDHLPFVLSADADVRAALANLGDAARLEQLSRKLTRLSHEAETRGLYVIGPDGTVVAGDDWQAADTRVGRKLADRPYFQRARETGKSSFLGVEPENNRVRYYIAEAIRDDAGLRGVAVVRIEFDTIEAAWERAGERVLVTDADGVVFLASEAEYKHRFLRIGSATMRASSESHKNYPQILGPAIDTGIVERRGADSILRVRTPAGDATYLYQSMQLPEFGWTIHRLTDLTPANEDRRDGAIIGGTLSALIISLLLYVMQRHRAYVAAHEAGERLKREVVERTRELSESNTSLQTEIDEHRRTEARLRATQNELVQAGKLAALGQMSAAIAHEINQPLAAIRTFVASTKIFAQRGDLSQVTSNLGLVNDLAERMASITAHLKTFARKSEPGRAEPILVSRAIDGALFLIESQTKTAGVRIEKDVELDVWVKGYAVQLEQVVLNLVGNALDAVTGRERPWIGLTVRASSDTVFITIADNGPGLPAERINQIFDPFFTTKAVGKGLGLGLSISYGIVQDFGGEILAANRPEGGAELTIELPRHLQQTAKPERTIHA